MSQSAGQEKKFPAPRFSEVVLKTSRFPELRTWYETVLDVEAFFVRSDAKAPTWTGAMRIAFIRIFLEFPYTQVLGIFEIPAVAGHANALGSEPGMHHMQLRHESLEHLFSRYEVLAARGIKPERSFNHGPGTSFYYRDPDRNTVEMSATNFENEADYLAYYRSDSYKRNVSGIEIDAAAYVSRYRAGTPREILVRID